MSFKTYKDSRAGFFKYILHRISAKYTKRQHSSAKKPRKQRIVVTLHDAATHERWANIKNNIFLPSFHSTPLPFLLSLLLHLSFCMGPKQHSIAAATSYIITGRHKKALKQSSHTSSGVAGLVHILEHSVQRGGLNFDLVCTDTGREGGVWSIHLARRRRKEEGGRL